MSGIERIGVTRRWSDAVIYGGTAFFVEVADDPNQDVRGQIAQILVDSGINVARRTVAKYREALKIPSSNDRRSIFLE